MTVRMAGPAERRNEIMPAIACMLIGTAVLTLNDALIKMLAESYPTGQLLFIRGRFRVALDPPLCHAHGRTEDATDL